MTPKFKKISNITILMDSTKTHMSEEEKSLAKPEKKRNLYKINYGLIALYFFLKSLDVLFTWYLITNYGLQGEMNPVLHLFFGIGGIDIFIFYIPIVALLIYNYHYRKDLFLLKVEFVAVTGFLIFLFYVVLNNWVAILVRL